MSKTIPEIAGDIVVAVFQGKGFVDAETVANYYETVYRRVLKCNTIHQEDV